MTESSMDVVLHMIYRLTGEQLRRKHDVQAYCANAMIYRGWTGGKTPEAILADVARVAITHAPDEVPSVPLPKVVL